MLNLDVGIVGVDTKVNVSYEQGLTGGWIPIHVQLIELH